ncbi:hypothetical protein C8F04DRAFT_568351 [Mycena alexandri]|uniref:Uncharacterized protein n=1 Tax=Mycena alexandri TaxID=1745969 RepID=A0AAD6SV28_9AGAR|nr:hypothetical protein C8F04DRAFT_568351 [Mycena alexandri]
MYSILLALALCTAASQARPTLKIRDSDPRGQNCTVVAAPDLNDRCGLNLASVETCTNDVFVTSEVCQPGTLCVELPLNNSTVNIRLGCSTLQEQTDLFAFAFGGVNNIPQERRNIID